MADNNLNLTTLRKVGEQHLKISDYVITNSEYVVQNYDNNGAVVLYIDHQGGPVTLDDEVRTDYRDLYIGDEHIAGGFGFVNTTVREKALDTVNNIVPNLETRIEKLEEYESTGSDGSALKNITIHPKYKYIKTEDSQYRLDLNESTGVISVYSSVSDKIYNIENYQQYYTDSGGPFYRQINGPEDMINNAVGLTYNFTYTTFNYEGDTEILGFYFSYSLDAATEAPTSTIINYDLCGSVGEYFKVKETNEYFVFEQMYMLSDPDLYPQTLQQKWKITFYNKFFEELYDIRRLHIEQGIINIKMNVVLENRKLTIPIVQIGMIPPVYYRTGELQNSDGAIGNSADMHTNYLSGRHKQIEITFTHDITNKEYDFIMIPMSVAGQVINRTDVKFTMKENGISFNWKYEYTRSPVLNNNKQVNYYVFSSPQCYRSSITWIVEI